MFRGSSGSRLHTLLSWWQTCIFQQHWLRVLNIPVGYAIWSYLTFEYISIFSYSFTCLASKVMLGSAESIISGVHGAESSPGGVLHHPSSPSGSCNSQQRRPQAEQNGRLAQVLGQSFRRIAVISGVQREQALSWPTGMGEDGEGQMCRWDVRWEQTGQFRLVIGGLVLNVHSQSSTESTREIFWGYSGDCKWCTNLISLIMILRLHPAAGTGHILSSILLGFDLPSLNVHPKEEFVTVCEACYCPDPIVRDRALGPDLGLAKGFLYNLTFEPIHEITQFCSLVCCLRGFHPIPHDTRPMRSWPSSPLEGMHFPCTTFSRGKPKMKFFQTLRESQMKEKYRN